MYVKIWFWIGSTGLWWTLLVSNSVPTALYLPVWALVGLSMACMGFNIGHDAIHNSISSNPKVNRFYAWVYELMGANVRNWSIAHNLVHHTWPNVPEHDGDIDPGSRLRFSPHAAHHWYHRYQHLYAWFLYAFITLHWVTVKDLQRVSRPNPVSGARSKPADYAKLVFGKCAHFGILLVVPLLVVDQPWWLTVAGFVTLHMVGGFTLSVAFQLAHIVGHAEYVRTDEDLSLPNNFAVHQLRTTVNFAPGNRVLCWFLGGLNHQVEHHLFPSVCHVHLPDIAPIVQQAADEHGIPYRAYPTVREALAAHTARLYELGRAPSPAA